MCDSTVVKPPRRCDRAWLAMRLPRSNSSMPRSVTRASIGNGISTGRSSSANTLARELGSFWNGRSFNEGSKAVIAASTCATVSKR
jgi:hypothetical protein